MRWPGRRVDPTSARRVRVLHVSARADGGTAAVATGYVRDQVERGWHVTVACPSTGGLGYAAREVGADARWWRVSGQRAGLLADTLALRRIVVETRPDVVHLHGGWAGLAGRLAVRDRVPTLVQPHTWSLVSPRRGRGSPGGPGALHEPTPVQRLADRWATQVVCVSAGEARRLERAGLRAPCVLVPLGVDLAAFASLGRAEARDRLGLADRPTALCVGSLTVQNGQQDLLLEWPRVSEAVPGARLVLVGGGPDRSALERLAGGRGDILFAGDRADVAWWLAAADVVVVPSRWGGVALVTLEAMACARSVVATDVEEMAQTLPEEAGEIVGVHDAAALAGAIVRRLRDPDLTAAEGQVGRAHVEARHDGRASARELAHLYLRVVGTRRGR